MRFKFKKISAVLTSALLTGMTIGIASAAAFPSDFTSQLPAIVYGASADPMDATQANAISNYLSDKVPSTGGDVTGGDSVKLEKPSTKFRLGLYAEDVINTSITDNSPGNGLPTLLADGKFVDDDNDEFDYKQTVKIANWQLTMFDNNNYKEDTPTVGVQIANGDPILNYTLDFSDKPCWEDLPTADLPLMGKEFYVLSKTVNTTLNLLDSADSTSLSEGETKQITVNGKPYDVSIKWIGASTVKLDINGEITNTLSAAETQRLSDGAYVGVKEINTQDYSGGVKTVQLSIGTGKLKLVSGSDVELNGESITGLKSVMENAGGTACSDGNQLNKLHLTWAAKGDVFIAPDSSATMPGFGVVKLSTTGMKYATEEKIRVDSGSSTYFKLSNFPLKDSVEEINLLYVMNTTTFQGSSNSSNELNVDHVDSINASLSSTGIGKDFDNQLITSSNGSLVYADEVGDYFIASFDDGKNAESYMIRATGWGATNDVPNVDFDYRKAGTWADLTDNAEDGDSISIGNVEFSIGYLNETLQVVGINVGTSVNFSTLYSKEGLKVFLPWVGNGSDSNNGTAPGWLVNGDMDMQVATTWILEVVEEDNNENIAGGNAINITIGFNTASTPEPSVTAITHTASGTSTEVGETDNFRNFEYSALATEVLWDKGGDQDGVDLTYHGEEAYGELYLTDSSATVGNVGNMVFKDNEQTSWGTRNVILVGGSCINSATATALGTEQVCGAAWSTATGIGDKMYLIKSVADKFTAGKIALVVAGYSKDDTAAATNKLISSNLDTAAGKSWTGRVGVEGTSAVTPT